MQYSEAQLTEAKRQIDSTLHKLREVVKTLEAKENPGRYKSQITLAKRRIEAFIIAVELIEKELVARPNRRTPTCQSSICVDELHVGQRTEQKGCRGFNVPRQPLLNRIDC